MDSFIHSLQIENGKARKQQSQGEEDGEKTDGDENECWVREDEDAATKVSNSRNQF